MMSRVLRFLSFAAGLAVLTAGAPETAPRLWPVPLEPAVSSNFCEYRDGRFHAGLDVRTHAREGIPCRAVADGWVSRIRISSRGYGRALHLTLDDGEQALYAHTAEFVPALEETVRAVQKAAGRYAVDFTLPEGRFRFRRGDVLAYSGSTGATAPHLHFETRSADGEAVNPFLTGFAVEDRMVPAVSTLALVPLDPDASIEGRCYPLEVAPRRVGAGRYAVDDTLVLGGAVGVAVGAYDRLNSASGRLAPYELDVFADDSLRSRIVLREFPFVLSGEVDLFYHAGALRAHGTRLFQLYERGGETLGGRTFHRGGSLTPGPGPGPVHEGRVVVGDVAGNRSEIVLHYVEGGAAPGFRTPRPSGAGDLAVDLDGAFFHEGFAVVPMQDRRRPRREHGHGGAAGAADTLVLRAPDLAGGVRAVQRPAAADTATAYVTALVRGAARTVPFPALGLSLTVAPDALYSDVVVFATRAGTARTAVGHGLVRRSKPVRVGPEGWVMRGDVEIRLAADSPDPRDAVFLYDDRGRDWSYLASTVDSAGVSARIGRPGVFAVLRDVTGPWLGAPRLVHATSYATGERFAELQIPVDDPGAGLDDGRISVSVGDTERIARWDFAKKKIIVDLRGEPIIGRQSVRVSAFDRVGNESVARATIDFDAR